jgi:RNA polymerase sigma-70 factor (ECF subfamily)
LVARYESRIYNQALRLTGNPSDAVDLVQEVLLGVYRNLKRFRGDAKFSTWVFRIVHNKSVDLLRRSAHATGASDSEDIIASLPAGESCEPDAQLTSTQRNARIQAMLAALPVEQRLVVELKVFNRSPLKRLPSFKVFQTTRPKPVSIRRSSAYKN